MPQSEPLGRVDTRSHGRGVPLVSEQYASVSDTATESLLIVMEDRLASLDDRLQSLEERMTRLAEQVNSLSAEAGAGCDHRGSSVWNRLLHFFQGGTNGKSQE